MIQELFIRNFAIIEESKISFDTGMTVLTGETGAGKSIIIDAIGQLLGQRAKPSMIKEGKDKAYIEAICDFDKESEIAYLLEEFHIDIEDDLYVSKEILANGKSICKINYKTVPASVLKRIMSQIIDIHSQFDNHSLLNEKNYLDVLDSFCMEEIKQNYDEYSKHYQLYCSYQQKLKNLQKQEDLLEQIDFYKSQLNELNQFDFENESVEDLEHEQEQMKQYEKIKENIGPFNQYIFGDNGALSSLYLALNYLDELKEHTEFTSIYNELYDLYYKMDELCQEITSIYNSLDFDEYRFNEIQEKLSIVQRLNKRYGPGIEMVIAKKNEIENHIDELEHYDDKIQEITQNIEKERESCYELAKIIHDIRLKKANELSLLITEQLHSLYMENAEFEIQVSIGNLQPNGYDHVQFLISTNVGHTKQSVAQIASGGELSRIMLALKTILLEHSNLSTIIFDEVDTGVSGKVAFAIGQKMNRIAKKKQVLCITHLPQVAVFAKNHLYVSKYIQNDDTKTKVELLTKEKREEEIAKMLSGDLISNQALLQAKNLIEQVTALNT